jgi:hypothetical protein
MCHDVLFMKSALILAEHENYCIDVSWSRRTGMHYVTHRSHNAKMQVQRYVSRRIFYGNYTGPTQA